MPRVDFGAIDRADDANAGNAISSVASRPLTMLVEPFDVRPARVCDAGALAQLSTGPIAQKRRFIAESFGGRTVIGAYAAERPVGYIVWDHAFFGRAFVWLLGVDVQFRRRGVAARLLAQFEACCPGQALFTSTNESNLPMHRLLARAGFVRSGRVENLDPGDPEIFYFKAPLGEADA